MPTPQTHHYELVAEIYKTKGLDGQLVAQELGGLSVLRPGLGVWIVPPTLEGVRHTVVREVIEDQHRRGVLLSLEGIDNRSEASELAGRYLLARKSDRDSAIADVGPVAAARDGAADDPAGGGTPAGAFGSSASAGLAFTDIHYGELGCLDSVKPGPAYDIWVLKGPYGQLEIPAVADYVVAEDAKLVTLALPQGFIEITGVGTAGITGELAAGITGGGARAGAGAAKGCNADLFPGRALSLGKDKG
jgi:16S rRNA processing protein RimM